MLLAKNVRRKPSIVFAVDKHPTLLYLAFAAENSLSKVRLDGRVQEGYSGRCGTVN